MKPKSKLVDLAINEEEEENEQEENEQEEEVVTLDKKNEEVDDKSTMDKQQSTNEEEESNFELDPRFNADAQESDDPIKETKAITSQNVIYIIRFIHQFYCLMFYLFLSQLLCISKIIQY